MQGRTSVTELSLLFLRLGLTAFGGPVAHIALMEHEVVRLRKWMSEQEFLDLISATNLIPGPNSTELAIHIGYRRAGLPGLFAAGVCFILPATIIVGFLAWLYVTYGNFPAAEGLLTGVKPVVLAIMVQAFCRLAPSAVKNKTLLILAVIIAGLNFCGIRELPLLALGGLSVALLGWKFHAGIENRTPALVPPILVPLLATAPVAVVPFSLSSLFWIFLKIGSVLFGSGYVLVSFLRSELVERTGWLTEIQLLDAVAIGQVTPGPVFTTATFIGYILSGPWGALMATIGIFLPAFIFVAISAPFLPVLRQSKVLSLLLDGVNVASLSLMAVVSFRLGWIVLTTPSTLAVFALSTYFLIRHPASSAWLIAAGGVVGIILS